MLMCGYIGAAQTIPIVYDVDMRGRKMVRSFPTSIATIGDTTLSLVGHYGIENGQERFRFVFTLEHEGSLFCRSKEHTVFTFYCERDTFDLTIEDEMGCLVGSHEYSLVFSAGDLGYEDNDYSLSKLGRVDSIVIVQLPEMESTFVVPSESAQFFHQFQLSLRIAYAKDENGPESNSNVRNSTGKEKSNRNTWRKNNTETVAPVSRGLSPFDLVSPFGRFPLR